MTIQPLLDAIHAYTEDESRLTHVKWAQSFAKRLNSHLKLLEANKIVVVRQEDADNL